MDEHIDMEERMRHVSENIARSTMHQAICNGDPRALARLQKEGSTTVTVDLRREAPLGQRQVESLLCFMVSPEIEKDLEDAEGDNVVYDALGEHRVLGRRKQRRS